MKNFLLACLFVFTAILSHAQNNVGIGTTTPDPSAALEIKSTNQGLLIPRMDSISRVNIQLPAKGLLVFDSDSQSFWYFNGTVWKNLTGADGADGAPGPQGPIGLTGADGADGTSVTIQGSVATSGDLPINDNATGDGYLTEDNGHLWVWNGSSWNDVGEIRGPAGADGTNGADGATGPQGATGLTGPAGADGANGIAGQDGLSAYQIWLANGNTGTEVEFLTSLDGADGTDGAAGANGADGATGSQGSIGLTGPAGADGTNGTAGQDGLSAYQIWLVNGNTGTEAEFLTSLEGADGSAGADGTNGADGADGATGSQGATGLTGPAGADGTNGVAGQDGLSAYQIWLANGNTGTEAEFLTSLEGADGTDGAAGTNGADGATGPQGSIGLTGPAGADGTDGTDGTNGVAGQDGLSAYQIWLANGNTGTEAEFLTSLEGADGSDGIDGADDQTITLNGDTLAIENGNYVVLPSGSIDTDQQTLTLIGDTLSISNGNSVVLPPATVSNGLLASDTCYSYEYSVINEPSGISLIDEDPFIWQSFTPDSAGFMTELEVRFQNFSGGYYRIYSGEGTGGTLLFDTTIPSMTDNVWSALTIPDNTVYMNANTQYTFYFEETGSDRDFTIRGHSPDAYAGGMSSSGSDEDLLFRAHLTDCAAHYIVSPANAEGNVNLAHIDTLEFSDGTQQSSAAPFIRSGNVIHPVSTNSDLVVGNDALYDNGSNVPRMFFDRSKAALRAGEYVDDYWDEAHIGDHSVAFGTRTIASSYASTAMGSQTIASGAISTAMGSSTTASGEVSTAMGEGTIASGYSSVAMGASTTAPSSFETAVGRYNTNYTPNEINGFIWNAADRLFTVGNGADNSTRSDAFVILKSGEIGIGTSTPDTTFHLLGKMKYQDGTEATGYLLTSDSVGNASWMPASGGNGIFTNINNVVLTDSTQVGFASNDFVFGSPQLDDDGIMEHDKRMFFDKSLAAFRAGISQDESWDVDSIGNYSFAGGFASKAKGYTSTSFGFKSQASGNISTSLGYSTVASGNNSTSMGRQTLANSFAETSMGMYNTDYTPNSASAWDAADRLLSVGNGTSSSNLSDAMVLMKNGNMGLGTSTPDTTFHLVGKMKYEDGTQADGYVLTSDSVGNASWRPATGGSSPFQLTGNIINPVDPNNDFVLGNDSLYGGGGDGGAANRMFFDASKAAFRAGSYDTSWDEPNVGNYSVAFGISSLAYGTGSYAAGTNTTASGNYSTAMGAFTTASGDYSTAMGRGTFARSGKELAVGAFNTDYTPNNTVNWNAADRLFSVGNGISGSARSDALVILKSGKIGIGTSTPDTTFHLVGKMKYVDGNQAAGFIPVSDANGVMTWTDPSTISTNNTAFFTKSTADTTNIIYSTTNNYGKNFLVNTDAVNYDGAGNDPKIMFIPTKYAFRVGVINNTNWDINSIGDASFASGVNTKASGYISTAMGGHTIASGSNSTAIGESTIASGDNSTSMGDYTTARAAYETAIGRYNTNLTPNSTSSWNAADRLFTIGNGTSSSNLSDAMVILKNGNMGIGTSTPDTTFHLVGKMKYEDGTQADGRVLTSDADGNASWQPGQTFTTDTLSIIADADHNTSINVEQSPNEDKIHFNIGGTEYFRMDSGRFVVTNNNQNMFFGNGSGSNNISGAGNTYFGFSAGLSKTSGYDNVGIGRNTLQADLSGIRNVAVGGFALNSLTDGVGNTAVGVDVLKNSNGNSNVALGFRAGRDNTGSGNVFLGYQAGMSENGSNKLYIANANVDSLNSLIYGDFDNKLLAVNGTLRVNDGTQSNGSVLASDNLGNASWQNVNALVNFNWNTTGNDLNNANSGNVGVNGMTFQNNGVLTTNNNWISGDGDAEGMQIDTAGNGNLSGGLALGGLLKTNGNWISGDGDAEGIKILNNGRVNIGSPNYQANQQLSVGGEFSGNTSYVATFQNKSSDDISTTKYNGILIYAGRNIDNDANSKMIDFVKHGNGQMGSIAQNGGGVAYQTASDIRLKTNITPTRFGMADLMKIEVKDYVFKDEPDAPTTGFIAQQLYTVYPDVVHVGGEDAKTDPWMVEYGKLTPLLVKAVQDQQKEIEEIKNSKENLRADNHTYSDRRLKKDISLITEALDKIQAINGYYYKWKDQPDTTLQVGVIAQEIEAVLPEIVRTDKDGYKSVDYSKLTALLIQAMKEQQDQIAAQQQELSEQKDDIKGLKAENSQNASRLNAIEEQLNLKASTK